MIENSHESETEAETESDSESLRLLVGLSGFRRKSFESHVVQIVPVHAEAHNHQI
jgi:hypothetical protein